VSTLTVAVARSFGEPSAGELGQQFGDRGSDQQFAGTSHEPNSRSSPSPNVFVVLSLGRNHATVKPVS
jgi:hypothetical protein